MKVSERVRFIRKNIAGLTMNDFGHRLGVGKTAISKLESGESSLTNQMCRAICREFHINETWLLDGDGPIEVEASSSPISDLVEEYDLDELDARLIEEYLKLTPSERDVLKDYMRSVFQIDARAADPAANLMADVASEEAAYIKRSGAVTDRGSSASSSTIDEQGSPGMHGVG